MYKKAVTLFLFFTFTLSSYGQNLYPNVDHQQQKEWVDSVYQTLTFEEQLGQLFMVAAYSNKNESHQNGIKKLIQKNNIGGLIFMQGGPVRQAQLTNQYQKLSKTPLLIAMDAEWGLSMRLDSTISFPKQLTLGAIPDNDLIYEMGAEIARQLKLIGVHVNFAPVIDINSNPRNPVIGVRSFGENKYKVAEKGISYMRGLQKNGIIANAKHFPGHGDTGKDSHYTLPIIHHSKERLSQVEFYPFKELMKDSLLSIMVGHIHLPAYDDTPNMASTLSKSVVSDLLAESLGFTGLVFTDALNMKGVSQFHSPGEVDIKALKAGNDVLLFSENVPKAIRKIKLAVKQHRISKDDLERKVKKILAAKYWVGLNKPKTINTDNLIQKLNSPQAYTLKQKIYEQAATVIKNEDNIIPIQLIDTASFASLSIGAEEKTTIFQNTLNTYAPFTHYHLSSNHIDLELLEKLKHYDYVIIGIHDLNNSHAKNYGINVRLNELLEALQAFTKVIVTTFGNPYSIKFFEGFKHSICLYEEAPFTHQIAAQIIFGALEAKGRLPISASIKIKEGYGENTNSTSRLGYALPSRQQMDAHTLDKIDEVIKEAISSKATPGCQVMVVKNRKIVFNKSYGYLRYDSLVSVNQNTVYDIASVTKVVATLQVFMFLHERGLVNVNDKMSTYLPELIGSNKESMIIKDILTHQAGLAPYIPFWKEYIEDPGLSDSLYHKNSDSLFTNQIAPDLYSFSALQDSIWNWIIKSDLREKKNRREPYDYKYSDLGFYMLIKLCEKIINQPIEDFLEQNFYGPLGLNNMTYLPLCKYPLDRIAPTEEDNIFRKGLVCGMVHDQGAALMGGIAGHAGIFSNALDLAILLQMNLQHGVYGGLRFFQDETIPLFSNAPYEDNRRGIGWDKPEIASNFGPTSNYASLNSFGHTGFTGTGVWVDPDYDLIYIFLSNRIHPNASNTKLIRYDIRTRVHDIIYESIFNYNKTLKYSKSTF